MDFLSSYLIVVTVSFIAMVSPGPDLLIVLRNALGLGRRKGIFTAFGIAVGLVIHMIYSVLGLSVVISQSVLLFNAIKYIGAGYLIWLGYKSIKSKGWSIEDAEKAQDKTKSDFKVFGEGFITNAFNPKATLFFLALFTQVIQPGTPLTWNAIYGLTIILMAFMWFSLVSIIFTNPVLRKALSKVSVWVDRVTGALLIGLGIKIIGEKL